MKIISWDHYKNWRFKVNRYSIILLIIVLSGLLFVPEKAPSIEWTKKSPMPGPLYAFNAAAIGSRIYAVGGRGGKQGYGRYNYVYDQKRDSWEVRKDLIYDRSNHAVVTSGGKIYVFGGNENPGKVEAYDPEKDSWKELADIPTPRQHINYSAVACRGKIYLIGGIEKRGERDFIITDKNEMYDPATNTWTEKAPIPSKRQMPAAICFEDKIYVISGTDEKWDDQTTVYVYDPGSDSWETRASMPEARNISGVAEVDGRIIVVTGLHGNYKKSKAFMYDPENDVWHSLSELPHYFMLAGVVSLNDRLYVLGGSNLESILSTCLEGNISF